MHEPPLTVLHKKSRLDYAHRNICTEPNWDAIIWTDEKRFNLDGPDGYQYYWHDLRKKQDSFSTCQQGGGGVMLWGAFSGSGVSELAVLEGKQNAENFIKTLSDYPLPFGMANYGHRFVFMQDGASIHSAKVTLKWLDEHKITL
jgi:hypothetical protein